MALSEKGFIKAFRSLDQSDIWQDAQLLRIWLTLMMRASWQDEWRRVGSAPVYCNIGDYCFSLREFADDLSLSRGFVKRRLEYLSKRDSIRLENGPRFIRATIINYEKYRDGADIDGPKTGQKRAKNGPITDHKRANSGPIAGQALYLEEVKEAKKDDSSLTLPKNHSPTPSNESLEPQIDQGFVADACRISESPKSLSESNLRSKGPSPAELADLWNQLTTGTDLPKAQLTQKSPRWKNAHARLKENPSLAYWGQVIQRIRDSAFCNGANDRGWTATFAWLIKPEVHERAMEGTYDDKKRVGTKEPTREEKLAEEDRKYREWYDKQYPVAKPVVIPPDAAKEWKMGPIGEKSRPFPIKGGGPL